MSGVEIAAKMSQIKAEILQLVAENKGQFTEDNCPIKATHYEDSQLLVGLLCINWDCPFCGFKVG
jgi:hypothetical protein